MQKDVIKSENVQCIHQADSKTFHVFTDRVDVMVMPLTDESGSPMINDAENREKAIKVLLSKGQLYVKGENASMIVSSNDKYYQVATTNLPNGPITTPVAINVGRIVSPCAGN